MEKLLKELDKAKDYLVIVEGKKDLATLKHLGFKKIFVINQSGTSLPEKIEQIQLANEKVCILTDFDKKGKELYLLFKSKLSELGVKQDNKLRSLLLKQKISHIEGLASFLEHEKEKY